MADTDPNTPETGESSSVPKIIPVVVLAILIIIAAAVWFFMQRPSHAPATAGKPVPAPGQTAQPAGQQPAPAAPASAVPPPPPVQTLSVDQLIQEASKAFKERRYVAPAGNNAVEFYLQVLVKDPKNQIAQDALREIFPFATGGVEQEINSGSLDEATREIDELAKVDPTNYTLTILRSKLDAKKKQVENAQKQAEAAAAKAAAAKQAAAQQAAAAPPPAAPPPPPKPVAEPAPPPQPAAAPAEKPPAPKGITRAAELVTSPPPQYPPEAYRRRVSGWVEIAFTVTAKGTVSNPSVTNAEPGRIFNSAALEAVRRWTFKPRMENGKAVPEKVTRRIEFKLGG